MLDRMYSSEKGTSRCVGGTSSDHGQEVVEPVVVKPGHDFGCQEHGSNDHRLRGSTLRGEGRWRRQGKALGPCIPHSATKTKQISTSNPWCFEVSMYASTYIIRLNLLLESPPLLRPRY